tara:strand:+ start:1777 stop:2055 length:279 start_codon:yes stop_codon:yes gene_type:complete
MPFYRIESLVMFTPNHSGGVGTDLFSWRVDVWLAKHGRIPMKFVSKFFKDESGATAIEYGLIAALIAVVIIGAVTALGTGVRDNMQTVADAI